MNGGTRKAVIYPCLKNWDWKRSVWKVATDNLLGNFIVFFGWSAPFFYLALKTYRKVSEPDYGTDNDPKGILVERAG